MKSPTIPERPGYFYFLPVRSICRRIRTTETAVPWSNAVERINATLHNNTATIATRGVKEFDLNLDGRLVDLDKPLHIVWDGKTETVTMHPQLQTVCQSMLRRGDPELAFSCQVHLGRPRKAD